MIYLINTITETKVDLKPKKLPSLKHLGCPLKKCVDYRNLWEIFYMMGTNILHFVKVRALFSPTTLNKIPKKSRGIVSGGFKH